MLSAVHSRRALLVAAGVLAALAPARADDLVRVGAIQMDGKLYDKEYNLGRAEALIRDAARRGARIVCTPECGGTGISQGLFTSGHLFRRS